MNRLGSVFKTSNMISWLILFMLGAVLQNSKCQILPEYDTVPKTSFSCEGRTYGYYADPEVNCQVFHICPGAYGVGHYSFLCPNQTVFNQAYLVCDHPYNVDCSTADGLYSINNNFFSLEDNDL
ncbi:U-scoloptoxin(01)-Cw1a-like [Argiope bruennichi]|nr:U-scoloptoxin(01)-Cw1a-like [Argiope bruennichi]XP_055947716.1 U-scoloptoxin(01)-Cw1a-like [Argiope bruennichi]